MENLLRGNHGHLSFDCDSGGGMAHFFRLIRPLFFWVLASVSASAFALIAASSSTEWTTQAWGNLYKGASASASCVAAGGELRTQVSVTSWNCFVPYVGVTNTFSAVVASCPANATLSGSSCSCNSTFVESGSSCISAADNCKAVAQAMSLGGSYTAAGGGLSLCYGGCSVNASASTTGKLGGVTQPSEYHGPFTSDGTTCTTSPASQTQTPCSVGSVLGTVNGLSTCSPDPSTNVIQAGPKTAASAPVSGASAPVVDSQAPTGSTGSSSSTSCTGGSCTTTKTYTNGSGAVTGTVIKTETQPEFCASNPGAAICQQSGTFSGTCGTAPACSGDAVMCAVAAATFATNCALKMPESSTEQAAYETAKTKTGDQTTNLPGSPTSDVAISPGSFSQADMIGAGSGGMTDLTVNVHGQSVTLPFSSINVWLGRLGYLLQAVTFLICAYIVTGNKQGGSA